MTKVALGEGANKILIPEPFRVLYTENLASLNPEKFVTLDKEGTDADYVRIKLIPPINPFLAYRVVKNSGYEIDSKYSIEKPLIIIKENEESIGEIDLKIKDKMLL